MSSPRGDNPFDKYRSQLNQIRDLALQERNVAEIWRHTCQWYQDDGGRELFVEALKHETGIQVNLNTDPHQRIGAALPKTWREYETKPRNDAYFRAVAELFLEEMDSIVSKVPRDCSDPKATLLYGNVIRFVKHVLGDSHLLFEEWGTFRADTPGVFGIRKSLFSHPVEFFHGARQIIYGHGTFNLSFADNHSELAVASIRQAVEIRLRQALGVIGKESLKDHTIHPIPLSVLLEALSTPTAQVNIPVPLEHLRRINHWANFHMHSGMRHYSWMPPRVLDYLGPFLRGVGVIGGCSTVNSGISMSRSSFCAIREAVKAKIETETAENEQSGFRVMLLDAEKCSVVFE